MKKNLMTSLAVGILVAGITGISQAGMIDWTDWQSATPNTSVIGSIGSTTVTYSGSYSFAQLGTGTNYWTEPNSTSLPYTGSTVIDNAPTPSELIALDNSTTNTITFSDALLNPVMAIVSLGRSYLPVEYAFDQTFSLLSEGQGYWGDGTYTILGNTLIGSELHAAIQFNGLVSSISWTNSPNEYWHGITVGATAPVPEPATMLLFGTGLIGLVGFARRKKK